MSLGSSDLGSLAQSARGKELKTARGILLGVGIITIAVNGFLMAHSGAEVDEVLAKQVSAVRAQGMAVDPVKLEDRRASILQAVRLIYGGALAAGVVFVIFGFIVRKYPVPITIAGLALYVGAAAIFGYLAPETLLQGIVIKIVIVVALLKSIQAAIAFQREQQRVAPENVAVMP